MKKLINSGIFLILVSLTGCKDSTSLAQNSDCVIDETGQEALIPEAISGELNLVKSADNTQDSEESTRACDIPPQSLIEDSPSGQIEVSAQLRNFTTKQETKMREALRRLKIIVNSETFKERVINHKYKDEFTYIDNNGFSNEQIYDAIVAGAETLDPEVDHEIDLDFTMYYKRNNVVGYTYPSTKRIWVNSRFFNSASYGKVAKNALHEWTHKIGFGHSFKYNSRRPFSVPYGVGTIIQKLVDGM